MMPEGWAKRILWTCGAITALVGAGAAGGRAISWGWENLKRVEAIWNEDFTRTHSQLDGLSKDVAKVSAKQDKLVKAYEDHERHMEERLDNLDRTLRAIYFREARRHRFGLTTITAGDVDDR